MNAGLNDGVNTVRRPLPGRERRRKQPRRTSVMTRSRRAARRGLRHPRNVAEIMKGRIAKICFVAALFLFGISFVQADAKRSITKITGDLYRHQNSFHYSLFLVTSDGIIVTDPINANAARWLKAELAKRFNKPIKYLIYSHDHVDHIAGGEVFADTATVVAHENTKADIRAEPRPSAGAARTCSDQMTIECGGGGSLQESSAGI